MSRIVGVKRKLSSTDSSLSGGSDGVHSFENSQDRNEDVPVIEEASTEGASEESLTEKVSVMVGNLTFDCRERNGIENLRCVSHESSVMEAENVIMSAPRVEWELENDVLGWQELSYVVYEDENDIPDLEESSESGVESGSYCVDECDVRGAEG